MVKLYIYKIKLTLMVLIIISVAGLHAQENHRLFTEILKSYVNNGLVNYTALKTDKRLNEYVDFLYGTNPDTISNKKDKLAFWINAYNAFTLKVIADHYPIESINELHSGGRILSHVLGTTVWHKDIFKINGKPVSLNNIEHDIIRKKFKEPRIHFALVCAAVSCPPLRSEAYEGYKLDDQLDDQARKFFNDKTKNIFDRKKHLAKLSKIMDWYESDFGNSDEDVLKFIAKYLPDEIAKNIKQQPGEWEIDYLDYDWALNDSKK